MNLLVSPYTAFRCDTKVGIFFDKFSFFFHYSCGFYFIFLHEWYFVPIAVVIADCAQYCPEVSLSWVVFGVGLNGFQVRPMCRLLLGNGATYPLPRSRRQQS